MPAGSTFTSLFEEFDAYNPLTVSWSFSGALNSDNNAVAVKNIEFYLRMGINCAYLTPKTFRTTLLKEIPVMPTRYIPYKIKLYDCQAYVTSPSRVEDA